MIIRKETLKLKKNFFNYNYYTNIMMLHIKFKYQTFFLIIMKNYQIFTIFQLKIMIHLILEILFY